MKAKLILLLSLFSAISMAQTAYTWVDDDGVRHFSDTAPSHDSETIVLADAPPAGPIPVEEAQPVEEDGTTAQSNDETTESEEQSLAKEEEKVPPLELHWQSPRHNSTIRSNPGKLHIYIQLSRKLKVGETLQLMVDNEPFGAPQLRNKWEVTNVDRGEHTLVINALKDGKVIAATQAITVHLHRARVKPAESAL